MSNLIGEHDGDTELIETDTGLIETMRARIAALNKKDISMNVTRSSSSLENIPEDNSKNNSISSDCDIKNTQINSSGKNVELTKTINSSENLSGSLLKLSFDYSNTRQIRTYSGINRKRKLSIDDKTQYGKYSTTDSLVAEGDKQGISLNQNDKNKSQTADEASASKTDIEEGTNNETPKLSPIKIIRTKRKRTRSFYSDFHQNLFLYRIKDTSNMVNEALTGNKCQLDALPNEEVLDNFLNDSNANNKLDKANESEINMQHINCDLPGSKTIQEQKNTQITDTLKETHNIQSTSPLTVGNQDDGCSLEKMQVKSPQVTPTTTIRGRKRTRSFYQDLLTVENDIKDNVSHTADKELTANNECNLDALPPKLNKECLDSSLNDSHANNKLDKANESEINVQHTNCDLPGSKTTQEQKNTQITDVLNETCNIQSTSPLSVGNQDDGCSLEKMQVKSPKVTPTTTIRGQRRTRSFYNNNSNQDLLTVENDIKDNVSHTADKVLTANNECNLDALFLKTTNEVGSNNSLNKSENNMECTNYGLSDSKTTKRRRRTQHSDTKHQVNLENSVQTALLPTFNEEKNINSLTNDENAKLAYKEVEEQKTEPKTRRSLRIKTQNSYQLLQTSLYVKDDRSTDKSNTSLITVPSGTKKRGWKKAQEVNNVHSLQNIPSANSVIETSMPIEKKKSRRSSKKNIKNTEDSIPNLLLYLNKPLDVNNYDEDMKLTNTKTTKKRKRQPSPEKAKQNDSDTFNVNNIKEPTPPNNEEKTVTSKGHKRKQSLQTRIVDNNSPEYKLVTNIHTNSKTTTTKPKKRQISPKVKKNNKKQALETNTENIDLSDGKPTVNQPTNPKAKKGKKKQALKTKIDELPSNNFNKSDAKALGNKQMTLKIKKTRKKRSPKNKVKITNQHSTVCNNSSHVSDNLFNNHLNKSVEKQTRPVNHKRYSRKRLNFIKYDNKKIIVTNRTKKNSPIKVTRNDPLVNLSRSALFKVPIWEWETFYTQFSLAEACLRNNTTEDTSVENIQTQEKRRGHLKNADKSIIKKLVEHKKDVGQFYKFGYLCKSQGLLSYGCNMFKCLKESACSCQKVPIDEAKQEEIAILEESLTLYTDRYYNEKYYNASRPVTCDEGVSVKDLQDIGIIKGCSISLDKDDFSNIVPYCWDHFIYDCNCQSKYTNSRQKPSFNPATLLKYLRYDLESTGLNNEVDNEDDINVTSKDNPHIILEGECCESIDDIELIEEKLDVKDVQDQEVDFNYDSDSNSLCAVDLSKKNIEIKEDVVCNVEDQGQSDLLSNQNILSTVDNVKNEDNGNMYFKDNSIEEDIVCIVEDQDESDLLSNQNMLCTVDNVKNEDNDNIKDNSIEKFLNGRDIEFCLIDEEEEEEGNNSNSQTKSCNVDKNNGKSNIKQNFDTVIMRIENEDKPNYRNINNNIKDKTKNSIQSIASQNKNDFLDDQNIVICTAVDSNTERTENNSPYINDRGKDPCRNINFHDYINTMVEYNGENEIANEVALVKEEDIKIEEEELMTKSIEKHFDPKKLVSDEISEEADRIRLTLSVQLPSITIAGKWRVLRLIPDLVHVKFSLCNAIVKSSCISSAISKARDNKTTVCIKSGILERWYHHYNFGIYCVHNHSNKIFIGPYLLNRKNDDLEVFVKRDGINVKVNEGSESNVIKSNHWFFQEKSNNPPHLSSEDDVQNITVIDLTCDDDDDEDTDRYN